jgi:hydrogenase-4 component E
MPDPAYTAVLESLNALAGGLFLLTAFAIVATRQARGCLLLFIAQSLLLAASAFVLGAQHHSLHLAAVGAVNLVSKPIVIPWILRRTLSAEVYARREIDQVLNIPTSLLIALALAVLAYFLTLPILEAVAPQFRSANVPIGVAGLLLGAYTLTVRREAVPMLIGILAMENGAFFAGIALSRELPLIVELAIASDGLVLVFVTGVLVRAIQQRIGSTRVGELVSLREQSAPDALAEEAP